MSRNQMLGDLMKQAKSLQEKMAKVQEEAAQKSIEATSGGGMVSVSVSGRQQLLAITIDPEVVKAGDIEMLQDLVMAAVNEGLRKSQEMVAEEMKGMTGGMSIPGLF